MEKATKLMKFWFPIIIILILLMVALFGEDNFPQWIVNASEVVSVLTALFLYLKDNSTRVFVGWNKFKGYFKRDTVSWEGTHKFAFMDENYRFEQDIDELIKRITMTLGGAKIEKRTTRETSASFTIKYEGYSRNIDIFYRQLEESKYILRFSYEVSLSYSDSKDEIKRFENILDLVIKNHRVIGYDAITSNEEKSLYTIKLSFSKFNPFFGLAIRNIDKNADDVSFILRFSVNDTKIEINKKTLKAVSENKEQLINVLDNYITLSTIG